MVQTVYWEQYPAHENNGGMIYEIDRNAFNVHIQFRRESDTPIDGKR